jgi:ribosome-associated protein
MLGQQPSTTFDDTNNNNNNVLLDGSNGNGNTIITPVIDDATLDLMNCIVIAADGRKAENIAALYVAHITTITSILIVVSGNSRPQNQAICAAIRTAVSELNQQKMKLDNDTTTTSASTTPAQTNNSHTKSYYNQPTIEGTAESGWMILDYGSIMVHVMTPKSRLFYNVEGKWKQPQPIIVSSTNMMSTAISLDLSHLLIPNTAVPTIASNTFQQQQQQQNTAPQISFDLDDNDVMNQRMDESLLVDNENEDYIVTEELDPFWS